MFHLKKPLNKSGSTLIFLIFNYHAVRFKMSTDLTIQPEWWDLKRERPKRGFKYYAQYCALLDQIETALHEAYLELKLTCIPSKQQLKAAILTKLNRPGKVTVAEYCTRYAAEKTGITEGTRRQFKLIAGYLAEYAPKATLTDVSLTFMFGYRDFLLGKKFSPNTVASLFKRLKTVLRDAEDKGMTVSQEFKSRRVKAETADTTQIFLTEPELDQFRAAKVMEWMEIYRDLFLVMCYTGVRFSDISKINRDSFATSGLHTYFQITDKKENAVATIPAHPVVLKIMKKYNFALPLIQNSEFNKYIKVIGRLAKIDTPIVETKYPGGIRVDTVRPKWQLIKAHTGRRSLICNLLIAGMNRETIKAISGHKTDAAFQRYIRLTPSDHLKVAFRSSFFKMTDMSVKTGG